MTRYTTQPAASPGGEQPSVPAAAARGWVALPDALRARLAALAGRRHPAEACGLLLGTREPGGARVREVLEAGNRAADPRARFELDPAGWLRAEERAASAGLEVVGVWHSHPDAPAVPSAQDRAGVWSGWWQVIVSAGPRAARGPLALRAWRPAATGFEECELRS